MARTKASVGAKVASVKSSKARCSAAPPPSSSGAHGSSERSSRNTIGGNPVCPRETPVWQKPITSFFGSQSCRDENMGPDDDDNVVAGTSKAKPKRNVIESDDEEEPINEEKPKNTVLDETIELEPLTGENCHKIEEYYAKNGEKHGVNEENGDKNEELNVDIDNNSANTDITSVNGHNSNEEHETPNQNGSVKQNGDAPKQKGKGIGKKTNKENINSNIEKRKSVKRDLEDVAVNGESSHISKKVKVAS